MARFEVFILNYNGAHFLKACLDGLQSLRLEEHSLTINIVDNASSDNSAAFVASHYPSVNFIALEQNFGFSRGNNLGVKRRQEMLQRENQNADYYIFLNNDTVVDQNWLLAAAETLQEDPSIGMLGSKSIFLDRFCCINITTTPTFVPTSYGSNDSRELAVFLKSQIKSYNINLDPRRIKIGNAYAEEGTAHHRGRWLSGNSQIFLPVLDTKKRTRLSLTLENHHPEKLPITTTVALTNGMQQSQSKTIHFGQPETFSLVVAPDSYVDVIQNAGSYLTDTWEGGDSGFLEIDAGQRDLPNTPDAICGVSCFIRSELFAKLGGFDEHYFAYYEDTDLSLRAKALGFKLQYCPQSILRHVHCGSGVEFSDYFNENVAYSHLVFGSKFMPTELWRAKLRICKENAKREFAQFYLDGKIGNKPQLRAYCRFLKQLPFFFTNRLRHKKFLKEIS